MKDSNKISKKSSSDSKNLVKNIIPEKPKDKRTKAYKDWVKQYGEKTLDSKKIPEMPKDKRTKAYKDWMKQYGNEKTTSKKISKKVEVKKTTGSEVKKIKPKIIKDNLEELINSFIDLLILKIGFTKEKKLKV